ncbi:MAG: HAD family hydrolase [Chloroflexi bacterium]|jgi:putative hydrolase of the HAD superfamily|nr:HAD family hydrolase [Chloroflexota bacterium]
MLDVIAFDADDTLWHTELYYRQAEQRYLAMLAACGVSTEDALAALHRLEIDNLVYFGYGIRGFILSMIEAAIQVSAGRVSTSDIQEMIELGRGMTGHEIRLLDGVRETLDSLTGRRLMLITKGDTLDQESKIRRSGLAGYFPLVEIVLDKTPEAYASVFARHSIDPTRFVMVGNSLRSDIAPVLALGGYAVHIPYPDSWAHESAADLPADRSRFFEISSMHQLGEVIAKIEAQITQAGPR